MTSTPTLSNGFEMQGTGDNAGTWGEVLDRALAVIDESADGLTTVPVGPSDITLSSTVFVSNQARRRMLKLTGVGAANVVIPGVPKWYLVHNACTGAVTIKTASHAGISIAPGSVTSIYCDAANCVQATSLWPLADGTAATPALYFSTDVSTGLYRVGAGTIGVTTGGSRILTVSPAGLATSLSTNGPLTNTITNANAGTSADAYFAASNGTGTLRTGYRGTAQTAYGALVAGAGYLYLSAAPLVLMADGASGQLRFASGGNTETARNSTTSGITTWRFGLSSYAFSASVAAVSIGYAGTGTQYGITMLPQTDITTAIEFKNAFGTTVGSISQTATATAYNTSSDYRLKDDIIDLDGSSAFIDALQPRRFTWKADGAPAVGFIAHEMAAVSPSSVTGEKDAVDAIGQPLYQGMQASSPEIIAMMIAELQSLRARVAALEA